MDDLERLERFLQWQRDRSRDRAARRRLWAVPVVALVSIGIVAVGLAAWLKANAPPPASSSAGARVAAIDQPAVTQPPAVVGPSAVAAPPAIEAPPGTVTPHPTAERPAGTVRSAVPPQAMTPPALRSDRRAPQRVGPKTALSTARRPPLSDTGRQHPGPAPVDSPDSALSPADSPGAKRAEPPAPPAEPLGPTPVDPPVPPTAISAEHADAPEVAAAVAPPSPAPQLPTESPAPAPEPRVSTAPPPVDVAADPGRSATASPETGVGTAVTAPPRVSDRMARWAKGEIQEFRNGVKREIDDFRSGLEKVRRGIDALRSRLRGAD